LQGRARVAGAPVIYVNDNFGRWRSDLRAQVEFCLAKDSRGYELVGQSSRTRRLIVTGTAGNVCVFFTANDTYRRDYELVVHRHADVEIITYFREAVISHNNSLGNEGRMESERSAGNERGRSLAVRESTCPRRGKAQSVRLANTVFRSCHQNAKG
jgi:hypothetical protein